MRIAVRIRPALPEDDLSAFAVGGRAFGDEVIEWKAPEQSVPRKADAIAIWGWRRGEVHRKNGHQVLVLERAYVDDRFRWISAGWNGLNGHARFVYVDDGGARWREHFAHLLKPWRAHDDGHVLIMGQVPTDTAVRSVKFPEWLAKQAAEIRRITGEPPLFRPHPNFPRLRVPGTVLSTEPLDAALAGARQVVTFNSNSGVDSVLAGTPTVAVDPGSMAYAVATHDGREAPGRPDRAQWAHRIAWAQWLPSEMRSGEAWARLRTLI